MSEIILTIEGVDLLDLYGKHDVNLDILRNAYPDITITSRGNNLKIKGDKKLAQDAKGKVEIMVRMLKQNQELSVHNLKDLLEGGNNPFANKLNSNNPSNIIVYGRDGRPIKARTKNQKRLVEMCDDNDIVFAIGPAGTGKTYTAVALAVRALKNRLVRRIILTRPAVEAGENLGFLPGDLKDKVDPYLRPLYDALDDMLPFEKLNHFMANRTIEVAPLAFMRGRTLDNAFIILDEAQNATTTQLKMFLTRIGPSAKAIITGDLTQIDLPRNQRSGLGTSLRILKDISGIGVLNLSAEDVVRHRLVKSIIKAYGVESEIQKKEREERKALKEAQFNKERDSDN